MAKGAERTKRKTVLASGVLDLLHVGHVKFLEAAKRAGGRNARLVVIIATDRTVEQLKGRRPVVPQDQRKALVEALRVVDLAILGSEDFSITNVLEKIKPDVIALGYDSHVSRLENEVREALKKRNLSTKVVKIRHFAQDELDSSSKIKKRIIEDSKA